MQTTVNIKMLWWLQTVLINLILINSINASAIPMWEYLSKQEKMSYLYSTFTNQVDEYCKHVQMKNCYQELLKYGLGRLKDMSEEYLDTMDPYQRNANDIIWDSMMKGHEMMNNSHKSSTTTTTTTPKPNSYEDDTFNDDNDGYQGAASARIDTFYPSVVLAPAPSKNHLSGINVGKPQYYPTYPHNFQYHPKLTTTTTTTSRPTISQIPVIGPMVVRVYPDGRPVNEPKYTLPQDDDLRQYQMSHIQIPNF